MVARHLAAAKILVVDDEPANLELLADCLAAEGYSSVLCISDSREAMAAYGSFEPDLVLLDLHMPGLDGFEILRLIGDRVSEQEYLPILVLTADVTEVTKERALSGGANDFLTKPLNLSEAVLRIGNLLHTRYLHLQQREARRAAEEAERRATIVADASRVLASSLDRETTLSTFCRTAVPRLADFCIVDLLQDDGTIRRVGAAHVDPAKEALLRDIAEAETPTWNGHPVYASLGDVGTVLDLEDTAAATLLGPGVASEIWGPGPIRPCCVIAVPLSTAGVLHGALVMATSESGRKFGQGDLELAGELARRAALTIENARLYDRALEATRAREELLAIVAHDLRNPLSTVTMGSTLLLEESTDPRHKRYAELVGRAAERMDRLIQDLLQLARVQSQTLRVEPRPERVGAVVDEAVAMLQPLAEARSIELVARVAPDLPLVTMDAARILQVLSNLVGNALKFTPTGGRIEITCEEVEGVVHFAVADSGPGIPPDQIDHIFGRFWQASDRDARGIGLGLSIVRGIVEAHGGRVWVESKPGEGATFYFTLSSGDESVAELAAEAVEEDAGVG